MELTNEMQMAFELIENTNENLYITGKAGTGKTTFLKWLNENCTKQHVVTASTGIAAINAGGVTLHSMFNIPMEPYIPGNKITGYNKSRQELLENVDVLIIDEISMVRPDVLDFVSSRLKQYKRCKDPFGGVQLVMFGDLYQLPPVIKSAESKILRNIYNGDYFYNSKDIVESGFRMVEFSKIFRQSEGDFISLLNNIREYKLTKNDLEMLSELRDASASQDFTTGSVHICSHKSDVARINDYMLGKYTHEFKAKCKDKFNINNAPCDSILKLREGARVMSLINDTSREIYNGSLGIVQKISPTCVTVEMDDGNTVDFSTYKWKNVTYKLDKKTKKIISEEVGSCSQIPLILAWAITIHKSQGLTFDNIVIHSKNMFCPGQMYVALSRCKTFGGISTESFISNKSIIYDKELVNFVETMKAHENIFTNETYFDFCKLKN